MRSPRLRTAVLAAPAVCLSLAAAGCASLSESECLNADWESIGESDGAHGHGRDRIRAHLEACAAYGVTPDRDAWAQGWRSGLDRYCTVSGGLHHGRRGGAYTGVCPAEIEPDFMEGYRVGRRIHDLHLEIREIEADIRDLRRDLDRDDLDEDYQRMLYFRMRDLEREQRSLERELDRLEDEARLLLRNA